jgi:error-prone DNA polymerase
MFVHLHTRSWFSFLQGGSSPEALACRAQQLGQHTLALTDVNGVYGAVRFQQACHEHGIRPIIGAELHCAGFPLVLLARSHVGYAQLCALLTRLHADTGEEPSVSVEDVREHARDLFCLTGGREGQLWSLASRCAYAEARDWLAGLREIFPETLFVELVNGLHADDLRLAKRLDQLAADMGLPTVATNDVRMAVPEDLPRYDLLTCIRLNITLSTPHRARARNAEAHLKSAAQMQQLLPFVAALERTEEIAAACDVELIAAEVTPPAARLPASCTPIQYLRDSCQEALPQKYSTEDRPAAQEQLDKELDVIRDLRLEEFFLIVCEVVVEARARNIRCAGRGSAANSIVTFLLSITTVDPLRHELLFERFLHRGRKGTPDIDVDFDSERRDEIIDWIETRFGIAHTAMTATLITYRLRLALRDVAKAFGYPMKIVNQVSRVVPGHYEPGHARHFKEDLQHVLADAPALELMLDMVEGLTGCPRHLGLHSGGMVLSRQPLHHFSPVQTSANGVKMVQFDKDDVEALGLIKLDVLGLRMLAAISEAAELADRYYDLSVDIDQVSLDDDQVYDFICTGRTLGLFQIESMGQMHLIASHQPRVFEDLVSQVALFRPGPLQGGMVHPFIRRRQGREPVRFDHPDLEPILRSTYGVILFQEQILEIAHKFAGMSLQEADDFRSLISKSRSAEQMEKMRGRFMEGAMGRGVPEPVARRVFDQVANFVGYGFCRSHAAAFARTVYQSAWLKRYYPDVFLAAIMQHRPGMYSLMTLEEEAKRCGVQVLPPDINRSSTRYELEPGAGKQHSIRKPLTAVKGVSVETAQRLVWARLDGPYRDMEDLLRRVAVPRQSLDLLARAGTLDSICGSSRRALWSGGVLSSRLSAALAAPSPPLPRVPLLSPEDVPELPELSMSERLVWDIQTHGAARMHPMALVRRVLNDLDVQTIGTCYRLTGLEEHQQIPVVVAGITMLKQKPGTAKGMMFATLEDETGFIQCIISPQVEGNHRAAIRSPGFIVQGMLQGKGSWRAIMAQAVYSFTGISGGTVGFPCAAGRDHTYIAVPETAAEGSPSPVEGIRTTWRPSRAAAGGEA